MKFIDIPPHVTELDPPPPFFWNEIRKKYNIDHDEEGIVPLYHLNYYDGPLSAMIRCGDKYFYSEVIYYMERIWWASWELTEDELQLITARHKLFQDNVGMHTDYFQDAEGNWTTTLGCDKPVEMHDNYYKNTTLPEVDYRKITEREIFGVHYSPFRGW